MIHMIHMIFPRGEGKSSGAGGIGGRAQFRKQIEKNQMGPVI